MATQFSPSIPTKRLASAILSTDMSFTLNNLLSWKGQADGVTTLVTADFPTTGRGVFRNTANTQIEFFTYDPTTVASGVITILTRGNDYRGGTADGAPTAAKYNWPANTTLVELGSNPPSVLEDYMDKISDEAVGGIKTFTSSPIVPTPTTASQAATKAYVDATTVAGAPNASSSVKGISKLSVDPVLNTNPIGVGQNDPQFVNYFADTGTANAYIITPASAVAAYVVGQRYSFKATNANTTVSTLNVSGLGAKTIKRTDGITDLVANDIVVGQIVLVEYDGTNFQLLSGSGNIPVIASNIKFGGTGADGVLSITSGITTIDLANAVNVTKNYTSISITGTGSLNFINPNSSGSIVILKSQGSVTLTSSATPMLDFSGLGAAGGAGGVATSSTGVNGTAGNDGLALINKSNKGTGSTTSPGTGGAVASFYASTMSYLTKYAPYLFLGAGGGGGYAVAVAAQTATAGAGGNGGGVGIIECAGSWNFTTSLGISVAGKSGANGSYTGSTNTESAGGGGGGGAGYFLGIYNTLTANTGSVSVAAGTGGNGSDGGAAFHIGGGGGGSLFNAGSNGITAGNTGSGSTSKCGGDGGAGYSLIVKNTEYA